MSAERQAGPTGRNRMVIGAAQLLGTRGVAGSSFSAVLRSSQAPRGSIYYYFPQGKRQLLRAAVEWTSDQVLAHQRNLHPKTPAEVVDHFLDFFRASIVSSECRAGCPLAAVALGTYSHEDHLGAAVQSSFRSWQSLLSAQLREAGVPGDRCQELATSILAAVEGALILCRAEGSVRPLDVVGRELRTVAARDATAIRRTASGRRTTPRSSRRRR